MRILKDGLPPKIIHRGVSIRADGAVSALCFVKQRKIDLSRASWTNRDHAVTCPICKKMLEASNDRERNQA
jgi:hypothetical protein